MKFRKYIVLFGIASLLITGTVGCRDKQLIAEGNPQKLNTEKISNNNRLIEIPLEGKVESNVSNPIYITIGPDTLPATIIGNKLIYVGDAPSEGNPISGVIQRITSIETVDKDKLEKTDEGYLLKFPTEDVSSIALNSDEGGYIPTVIEDKEFIMTISDNLYERSSEFTLTVRKDMEIDLGL